MDYLVVVEDVVGKDLEIPTQGPSEPDTGEIASNCGALGIECGEGNVVYDFDGSMRVIFNITSG
jgi:hypothetical protein